MSFESIIDARDLAVAGVSDGWVIVDCRYQLTDPAAGYRAYLSSHIPGATYAHLHDDLSGPPVTDHGRHPLPTPARLVEVFSGLGITSDTQVVVYDDAAGSIAARLWWMLRYMGHRTVAVLDGGWQAWQSLGLEAETGEVHGRHATFSGRPVSGMLVRIQDVPNQALLVDSRDPARYAGENETIDPVGGHIPGARNRFWRRNVDEDGRFLASGRLRAQLLDLYGDTDPAQVTFYCGSGVTACHNVLAAAVAGFPLPRLYAGSWSEWCSEPGRPVETGAGPQVP